MDPDVDTQCGQNGEVFFGYQVEYQGGHGPVQASRDEGPSFCIWRGYPIHLYLPHAYEKNLLIHTDTHDDITVRGWFEAEASPEDRKSFFDTLGERCL